MRLLTLIQYDLCTHKKTLLGHKQIQREDMWGYKEKTAVYTPKRKASGETSPAYILILDFYPPDDEK